MGRGVPGICRLRARGADPVDAVRALRTARARPAHRPRVIPETRVRRRQYRGVHVPRGAVRTVVADAIRLGACLRRFDFWRGPTADRHTGAAGSGFAATRLLFVLLLVILETLSVLV